jgi:hypothetical protein
MKKGYFKPLLISCKICLKGIFLGDSAINAIYISNSNLFFSGVGYDGIGNCHDETGFKTFTHYKGIMDKPTWLDPSIRYHPHTPVSVEADAVVNEMVRFKLCGKYLST